MKPGKEGMLGEVLLSLTLVFFQRNVEKEAKLKCEVNVEGTGDMVWLPGPPLPVKKRGREIVGDE